MNVIPGILRYQTEKNHQSPTPSTTPSATPSTTQTKGPSTNKCKVFQDNYYMCLLEKGPDVLKCERAYQFYETCQYYCHSSVNCDLYIKGLGNILKYAN